MTPPAYELRDKATGQVVPDFDNMDTAPGKYIEVYSGAAPGSPMDRISAGALQRPEDGGGNPDPGPDPPPATTGDMYLPANATEAAQYIRDATESSRPYIALFHPRTEIEIPQTLVVNTKDAGGFQYGIRWNGAKLLGTMASGPIVEIRGGAMLPGTYWSNVRKFEFSDVSISNEGSCDACLRISCPKGQEIRGLFEKLNLQGSSGHGLHLIGDLYESWFPNLHAENCQGSGVYIENGDGVISNIKFRDMNLSRNQGYGMETHSAHLHLDGGSFINNVKGGILAHAGLWQAHALQFENSGEICINVNWNQARTAIYGCEASGNGKWAGTGGLPTRYLLRFPHESDGNLYFPDHPFNKATGYDETGGGNNPPLDLRAP